VVVLNELIIVVGVAVAISGSSGDQGRSDTEQGMGVLCCPHNYI